MATPPCTNSGPIAFEPRHLNLQRNPALTDRDGLMLEQAEGVNLAFIGATLATLFSVFCSQRHSRATSSSRARSSVSLSAMSATP